MEFVHSLAPPKFATGGQIKAPDFNATIAALAGDIADQREDFARRLLKQRLPKRLRWTLDHPRILGLILKLRPRWKPVWAWVRLGTCTDEAAVQMAKTWAAEMRGREFPIPDALIFSYSGADGMPHELHGVPT